VRARFTTYSVPGWGVGELWTGDGLVLAHEFRFQPVSDTFSTGAEDEARPGTASRADLAPSSSRDDAGSAGGANGTHSARMALDEPLCLTPSLLVARFLAFFAGEDADFGDVPIDLGWATPFQHAVADALRAVPRGAVVSYGELAALAGRPGAARAAGSFCAHNRFMLIVPCHRVVGAAGLGGYGSAGLDTKRRLLALEGVEL
jgi:methylated-DNA-[protein]-cysteine S-methyltransferase